MPGEPIPSRLTRSDAAFRLSRTAHRAGCRRPRCRTSRGDSAISDRDFFRLILAGALLIAAIFFGIARLYEAGGHVSPPQGDSLIFYQYARAAAEGHPYRFNEHDAPTTGSTSHLYPFVLALPYALGAKGASLPTAGFLLNAVFYVALILAVWFSALKLTPSAAPLATALAALSGQTVITMFGQTDMGLFSALAAGAFCAALYRRYLLLSVLLVGAVLTRPEGALLAALLVAASFISTSAGRRGAIGFTFAGAIGLFAAAGVAFLNHRLTGSAGFSSIVGKGLMASETASGVLRGAAGILASMVKEVFFGLADGPRRFYLLPVFGGWLGVMGLLSRRWRRDEITRVETWWMSGVAAALLMISLSGDEGVQFDRYLAWVLPIWFIYVAIGLRHAAGMFPWPRAFVFMAAGLLAYQAMGLVYFGAAFAQRTAALASSIAFIEKAGAQLPEGGRVGVASLSGMAYYLPRQTVHNVNGVVTPEFLNAESSRASIEVLRHEPAARFNSWMLFANQTHGQWYSVFTGRQLAAEPPVFGAANALVLHEADWSTLDHAALPLTTSARQFVYGLGIVDELDVAYPAHEGRANYQTFTRVPGVRLPPVSETLRLEGRDLTEAGRIVLGSETMSLKAEAGREMRIILRTSSVAGLPVGGGIERFEFGSPMSLKLEVDGKDAGTSVVTLGGPDEFTEIGLRIAPELITRDRVDLTVGGDHIAYAYWFYQ